MRCAGRLSCLAVCIVFNLISAEGLSDSACYGITPKCDYYSLSCPSAEIIRLQKLYVGGKTEEVCQDVVSHCNDTSTCCSYSSTDTTELFNLKNTFDTYTNCSGKTFCENVQAPWQLMANGSPSTYVFLNYSCETTADKLNFCGGSSGRETKESESVEIMFDGSAEKFNASQASRECRCSITNTGLEEQDVVFTVIDIRLQTYYKNENRTAECSAASFTSDVLNAQCANTTIHHEVNFKYEERYNLALNGGAKSDITLGNIYENGQRDSPAMVWISLEAEKSGRVISVSCYEVLPAFLSTSTVTSAGSTPSTPSTQTAPTSAETVTEKRDSLSDDDEAQKKTIYLAVFIPIGVIFVVIIVLFICWKYRRNNLKKTNGRPDMHAQIGSNTMPIYIHDVSPSGPAVLGSEPCPAPINTISTGKILPTEAAAVKAADVKAGADYTILSTATRANQHNYSNIQLHAATANENVKPPSQNGEVRILVGSTSQMQKPQSYQTSLLVGKVNQPENNNAANADYKAAEVKTPSIKEKGVLPQHQDQTGEVRIHVGSTNQMQTPQSYQTSLLVGKVKQPENNKAANEDYKAVEVKAPSIKKEDVRPQLQDQTGIVIHIDNVNLPRSLPNSEKKDTMLSPSSKNLQFGEGGTPEQTNNLLPGKPSQDNRGSSPAVIVPDTDQLRHSGNAYVLPGKSGTDTSVLFVRL